MEQEKGQRGTKGDTQKKKVVKKGEREEKRNRQIERKRGTLRIQCKREMGR